MSPIIVVNNYMVNIGLEGLMLIGAFVGVLVGDVTSSGLLGVLAACAVGLALGLLHGAIAVYLRGDQIVAGVAMNLFAAGLVAYGIQAVWHVAGYKQTPQRALVDPNMFTALASAISFYIEQDETRHNYKGRWRGSGGGVQRRHRRL